MSAGAGPPAAALFDAAGTLIHTRVPVGETYAAVLAEHGAPIPAWRLEDAFARVLRRAPAMVFADRDGGALRAAEREWWWWRVRETVRAADSQARVADFDGCFARLWEHFAAPGAWVAAPGAGALLARLRAAGVRCAVASNFDHRLDAILRGLDLGAQLEAVIRPAHLGAAKPDPRFFRAACAHLDPPVAPGRAVYVGDDPEQDVAAARAAGLAAVCVRGLATLEDLAPRVLAPPPGARPQEEP